MARKGRKTRKSRRQAFPCPSRGGGREDYEGSLVAIARTRLCEPQRKARASARSRPGPGFSPDLWAAPDGDITV